MTYPKDFIVYDIPAMLSRDAVLRDPANPSKWVRDDTWYVSVQQHMAALFAFFQAHGLLVEPKRLPSVEQVVLKFSDFSEIGQRFVMTGAAERWLASFDRPGSKKLPSNVTYLEKQLAKLSS